MFVLDSLFLSGFRWVLDTVRTAAEAELNDDTALRERLMEAEMRREMGEIDDEEFAEIEADLLQRIREIKERREGGSGPIAFGGEPMETSPDSQFSIEATVSGDFHEPPAGDHGTVIEGTVVDSATVRRRQPRVAARRARPATRISRTTRRTKIR
jgi:hypothetical protein